MKKGFVALLGVTLIASSIMGPFSTKASAEETEGIQPIVGQSTFVEENGLEYEFIYEGDHLDHTEKMNTTGSLNIGKPNRGGITPYVHVSDGPIYTWDYIGTQKFDDVAYQTLKDKVTQILWAGLSATAIGKWLKSYFFAGAAGYIANDVAAALPKGKASYWTVKKYVDHDSYNVYVKQVISVYSDKARTKRVFYDVEIEKFSK